MLRTHARQLGRITRLVDLAVSGLIFCGLVFLHQTHRASGLTRPEAWSLLAVGLVGALAWLLAAERLGVYRSQRRRSSVEVLWTLGAVTLISTTAVAVAAFLTAAPVPRRLPLVFGLSQGLTLTLLRLLVMAGLRTLRRRGKNYREVLIVGTGTRARGVLDAIRAHREWGIHVVGFVDRQDYPVDASLASEQIHKIHDVPDLMRGQVVDEVILACPISMLAELRPLVAVCAEAGVPVIVLSELFDGLPPPRLTRLGSFSALSYAPVHHNRAKLAIKRFIDVVGAGSMLVLTAPILAVAAVLVRTTSSGPVLFRQQRCGLHGRRFDFLKLRSMQVNAHETRAGLMELNEMDGPVFKMSNDPRVTPVGRVLRKWSIDELPQLWNVLSGDMSLVGPRPPLPEEVALYQNLDRRRLSMRPGITCLWQVGGRNDIGFADWVKLDIQYIDTWSLAHDLEILLQTIPAVLRGTGR